MNTFKVDEKYAATIKYKPQEFARILGVSVKTLQRWDREGTLKAHRTLSNRRYYTYDQFKEITREQQGEGITERLRTALRAGLIRRDEIYIIMRDVFVNKELDTAENRIFVQDLINKVLELSPRWPSGVPMEQTVKLDADLIWNTEAKEIIHAYWSRQQDGSPKATICKKIIDSIDEVMREAETAAQI